LTLEFKTGTFVMPLIEEKIGIGSAGVYPDMGCARCVNVASLREMFHATTQRNRNVRNASL
jgi:hypothetical protein